MDHDLYRFWWLVFPIMWCVFGVFRMVIRAQEQRGHLELMRALIAQGRDPAEAAKVMGGGFPR